MQLGLEAADGGCLVSKIEIASFFSGLGGLDTGFAIASNDFQTVWANEIEAQIADSFELNHGSGIVNRRSLATLTPSDVPSTSGIIGGPPCQSWSAAGAKRGRNDPRGELFFKYVEIIRAKKPDFFVAENVPGLTHRRNSESLQFLLEDFVDSGYNVSFGVLNAADYGVAQDRRRLFIIGYRSDLGMYFVPPEKQVRLSLREVLNPLTPSAASAAIRDKNGVLVMPPDNNHYFDSHHFSYIYMSRNRVRSWDEQSFTIQASASHAPLHPMAPKMVKTGIDRYSFEPAAFEAGLYRRLSVRECALVQGFGLDYELSYSAINTGYKMIGNAVPVPLAAAIARKIHSDLVNPNTLAADFGSENAISFSELVSFGVTEKH